MAELVSKSFGLSYVTTSSQSVLVTWCWKPGKGVLVLNEGYFQSGSSAPQMSAILWYCFYGAISIGTIDAVLREGGITYSYFLPLAR